MIIYPKAKAVMAQAMSAEVAAEARLSLRHALMWLPPANFDTIPTTAANIENVRKKIVAPFPPKPNQTTRVYIVNNNNNSPNKFVRNSDKNLSMP